MEDIEDKLHSRGWLAEHEVVEELRLLANSMSTQKALAQKIGISASYLGDILDGRRTPGDTVLKFLKLKRMTIYIDAK